MYFGNESEHHFTKGRDFFFDVHMTVHHDKFLQ